MKSIIIHIICCGFCTGGFAQNLRFKQFGTPIPARPGMTIRWNAPSSSMPAKLWTYHLLPARFSRETISALMEIGAFTAKDRTDCGKDQIIFRSPDNSRHLTILFPAGVIAFDAAEKHGPTNLVANVPSADEAVTLTKNLLPKLGIALSDIDKKENSAEPDFRVADSVTEYYVNRVTVTNTEWRQVSFRRAVDGATFLGAGAGGDGEIQFGGQGRIIHIYISWRTLERQKSFPTLTVAAMMDSIRQGRAVQGLLPSRSPGIDWTKMKSLTVKNMWPCYYAGNPLHASDWLYPFAALSTTIDTGNGSIDVEVDCLVIADDHK